MAQELEIDRLRADFPRFHRAISQLYPFAWDEILRMADVSLARGRTASKAVNAQPIFRGLSQITRSWILRCLAADRRDILVRKQHSFLAALHEKPLDDLVAELKAIADADGAFDDSPAALAHAPTDDLPTGFVFISHHTKSSGVLALAIADGLEKLGRPCWVAPRDVGDDPDWNERVYSAAQRCGAIVVLLSKEAYASAYVKGEVHIVAGRGMPALVVKLAAGDPAKVNVSLALPNHIDWVGKPASDTPLLIQRIHGGLSGIGRTL